MKTLDKYERAFCNNLLKWYEKTYPGRPHGMGAKLAKKFGVSSGQFSSMLAARKPSNEFTRRKIANIINIPYDQMIGIDTGTELAHQIDTMRDKISQLSEYNRILVETIRQLCDPRNLDLNDILKKVSEMLNRADRKQIRENTLAIASLREHFEKYCKADIGKKERECYLEFKKHIEPILNKIENT